MFSESSLKFYHDGQGLSGNVMYTSLLLKVHAEVKGVGLLIHPLYFISPIISSKTSQPVG